MFGKQLEILRRDFVLVVLPLNGLGIRASRFLEQLHPLLHVLDLGLKAGDLLTVVFLHLCLFVLGEGKIGILHLCLGGGSLGARFSLGLGRLGLAVMSLPGGVAGLLCFGLFLLDVTG